MSFNTQKHSRLKLSKLVLEIYFFVTKNFEDECCNAVRLSRSNLSILSKNIFSRTSLRILLSNTFAPLEEFSNLSIFISFFSLLFLLFFYFFFLLLLFSFYPPPFTRIDHRLMQHSDPCFSQRSTFLRPTPARYLEAVQGRASLFEVHEEVQRLEEFKEAHEFFLPNGTALSLPLLHA